MIFFVSKLGFSQCPVVDGILVNSCSNQEGLDEMVNFSTGSSPLSINSLRITFALQGDWCNSGCGSNNWANGSAYFNSSINNDCTTSGNFILVNNTNGIIPANSRVIVFTSQTPSIDFNLTALCGTGPYYIVFANNASNTGRFANNSTAVRSVILTDQATCSQTVNYIGNPNFSNLDGDYVRYDAFGNPTYINLPSCVYVPSAFPTSTCSGLTISSISGLNNFCANSKGTFSLQTVSGATNYIWTVPTGCTFTTSGNGLTANIQFGTVSGNVQVTAYNSCSTVSSTKFVHIHLPLAATGTILGQNSLCVNSNGIFSTPTIAGASSYLWNVSPSGTIASGQGTYTVTVTSLFSNSTLTVSPFDNICSLGGATFQTLTVLSPPVIEPVISGPNTICSNLIGTYTISSVPNALNYNWGLSNQTITGTGQIASVRFGSSNATLTVSAFNTCGTISGLPYDVSVKQSIAPTGSITGVNSICPNTNYVFSVSTIFGASQYDWSITNDASITGGNLTNTITVLSGIQNTNIQVVPTTSICGIPTTSNLQVNIINRPNPITTISGPTSVCSSASTSGIVYSISSVSGASDYSWGFVGLSIISSSDDNLSKTIQLINSTASLTVSSLNQCYTVVGASLSISVNGNISPAGTISGLNSICPNLNPVYTIEPVSGASSYQWSASDGVSISLGQGTNTITLTSLNQGTILRVTPISTTCGNGQESQPFLVTIKSGLTAGPSVLGTSTICGNTNGIIYTLTTVTGATKYFWNIAGLSVVSTSGDSLTKTVNIGSKNATLTGFAMNECGTLAGVTFILNVKDKIAVPLAALGPFTICGNSLGTFTFPGTSNYPIIWDESFLPTSTIVGGQSTGIVSIKVGNFVGNASIYASTSDDCGGTYGWLYGIIVSSVLGANLVSNWPDTLCQNDVNIFSNTLFGASFHWSLPKDSKIITSSLDSSYVTIQFGSNSGIVTTTSYNACGNGPSKIKNVIVIPYPNSNAGGESNGGNIKLYPTVLDNNSVTLNGAGSSQNASATDLPRYSYNWYLNPPSIIIDNANSIIASFNPKELQTKVYFNVSNGYCSSLDSALINLDMDQIPNAFTPNGDDANDTWRIDNLYLYKNFKLTIFNKWGSPVKEFTSYESNPDKMWDGKSEGVDLPSAVYYYVLDYNGENGKKARKGTVTIVR